MNWYRFTMWACIVTADLSFWAFVAWAWWVCIWG